MGTWSSRAGRAACLAVLLANSWATPRPALASVVTLPDRRGAPSATAPHRPDVGWRLGRGCRGGDSVSEDADRYCPEDERDHGLSTLEVVGIIGLLIGGVIAIDALTGSHWASPDELDADGPRFPARQALGRFQVQGYGMGGWPVVLDFESEPGTTTWLELRTKGQDDGRGWRVDLPPGSGRRVEVIQVPEQWGDGGPRVTRYSVNSAVERDGRKPDYKRLTVYGIGAGPRAVGSMTIELTDFQPMEAVRPGDVRFALVASRLFDRSKLEVLRLPQRGDKLELVRDQRMFPLEPGVHRSDWTVMGVRPQPRAGRYAMQARAWLVGSNRDERDWTGAFAPNFVEVR